jgi:rod shape-determining protein MreC
MEYSPPPFFKRGPSLLTRFTFVTIISVVLLVLDARFNYLQVLRQAIAAVVYPLQRLSSLPGGLASRVGDFFVTQTTAAENEQLRAGLRIPRPWRCKVPGERARHLRRLLECGTGCRAQSSRPRSLCAPRPLTRRVVVDKGFQQGWAGLAVVDDAAVGQVTPFPWAPGYPGHRRSEPYHQAVRSGLRRRTFGIGMTAPWSCASCR